MSSNAGISSVTYATADFGQEQDTSISGSTWSKTIPTIGVQTPILTAQAAGGSSVITCTITVDGQQVVKQRSRGPYAVVTCTAP